ncbi:hypothetical protein [Streptomyces sp. NPDC002580]|uniref:hypothetical protein n=1 Tax=Streptomyces sp. NPDC002580 TaxID=3364653 RepID=UPI003692FAB4
MAGIRDSLGRVGYDLLSNALSECQGTLATGKLRVSGTPGGVFHLRDGCVVAVESPGAPGPEARLLRSGRISGEQWAELLREGGGTRWPEAGLIAHGYAGAAQLRVVCMMAMQDAAFAVVAGDVEACDPLDAAFEPYAPVELGEAPGRLLQDAARKLAAVAALPRPVRPDRERPVPAAVLPDEVRDRLPAPQRELLAHADGRRTARDIAFATGLGAYTVTVGMARMLGEGLLELPEKPGPATEVTVRVPPSGTLRQRPPATTDPTESSPQPPTASPEDPAPRDPAPVPESTPTAPSDQDPTPSPDPTPPPDSTPTPEPVPPPDSAPTSESGPVPDSVPAPDSGPEPRPDPEPGPAPDSEPGPVPEPSLAPEFGLASVLGSAPEPGRAAERDAGAGVGAPVPSLPRREPGANAPSLPRREPGASGITETLAPERAEASWKGFFRLRHRIWAPDSST